MTSAENPSGTKTPASDNTDPTQESKHQSSAEDDGTGVEPIPDADATATQLQSADANDEQDTAPVSDAEATIDEELDSGDEDEVRPPKPIDHEAAALALACQVFADLPLHAKVLECIGKIGWTAPTPVQKLCLPYTLRNHDVAGFAQTGTGKTGVFLITICNKLLTVSEDAKPRGTSPRAVILAPTRELAMQIEDDAQGLLKDSGLQSLAVFGGIDYDKQAAKLREGVDVIVATPGRLMDYVKKGVVKLDDIQVFVCDEADRMFDMGFIEDVEFFLKRIPEKTQRLLFSATTNEQVKELAFEYLESPEYISVNPEVLTPERIEQKALHVHARHKLRVMMGLLHADKPECALIFTNTKLTADWLHYKLTHNGFEVDLITGDLPQKKRIRLIERIKAGQLKLLIATDVASRGLHISRVTHVYNFDLPDDPANYIHRIGRTARAGARGTAISLVCDDYGQNLSDINKMLGPTYAVQSSWYDEDYLKIEDKAGNPFETRERARREAERERERDEDMGRKPRPRHGGAHHGADGRGADGRGPEGRGRIGGGRSQGARGPSPEGAEGQQGGRRRQRGRGGDRPQHEPRQQHGKGRHGERHQGRDRQHHRDGKQHARSQHSSGPHHATLTPPNTFFGMLKRLFLSIFGRRQKRK